MQSEKFNRLINCLHHNSTVHLADLDVRQFKVIIQKAMYTKILPKIEFVGQFSNAQLSILTNRYVSQSYYYNADSVRQLTELSRKYRIELGGKYNFLFADNLRHAFMHGYSAADITRLDGRRQILSYLANLNLHLRHAIQADAYDQVRMAVFSGAKVNESYEGLLPLERALQKPNGDIVDFLLYQGRADPNLAITAACNCKELDIAKLVINHKNVRDTCATLVGRVIFYNNTDLLKYLIKNTNWSKEKNYKQEIEQALIYARQMDRPELVLILTTLPYLVLMFDSARNNDLDGILSTAKAVDIDHKLDGRTVLHYLAHLQNNNIINSLLQSSRVFPDPNLPDDNGDYLISICIKTGNSSLLMSLLKMEHVNYFDYDDTERDGYTVNLDPIKLAIDVNNLSVLVCLLKMTSNTNRLISVNLTTFNLLEKYAQQKNAVEIVNRLQSYSKILLNGKPLFENQDPYLEVLASDKQGISRVDVSWVSSMMLLCDHFNLNIVIDGKSRRLTSNTFEFGKIIQELLPYINSFRNISYKVYVDNQKEGALVDDVTCRQWAKTIYDYIDQGSVVNNQSYSGFRTSWINSNGVLSAHDGLPIKDVLELAILAAKDRNAIDGLYLDNDAIDDRMSLLVYALIEAERAYHFDAGSYHDDGKKYIDNGSGESCLHGVASRFFVFLHKMHKCINIVSDPKEWAADEAKTALVNYFKVRRDRSQISTMIMKREDELDKNEREILIKFYKKAGNVVRRHLKKTPGLITGKKRGYLLQNELDTIVTNIRHITLPLSVQVDLSATSVRTAYADFSIVNTCKDLSDHLQVKLPDTNNAVLEAIIISAADNGGDMSLPMLSSTQNLRNTVADILHKALIEKDKNLPFQKPAAFSVIEHSFASMYGEVSLNFRKQYVEAVASTGLPDSLILTIIAAMLSRTIRIFSLSGAYVRDISGQPLFVKAEFDPLAICVHAYQNDDSPNYKLDYNFANALIKTTNWNDMQNVIKNLANFTLRDQLAMNDTPSRNFNVMVGHNVAGLLQIHIPGDGNCLFNAVLIGAKLAKTPLVDHLSDCDSLRLQLKLRLESLYSAGLAAQTTSGGNNEILNNLNTAVLEFNELNFSEPVTSIEQYIEEIGKPGRWGGHLELQILSELLQAKIVVYTAGRDIPDTIGANFLHTINLRYALNHYNLLIEPDQKNQQLAIPLGYQSDKEPPQKRPRPALKVSHR